VARELLDKGAIGDIKYYPYHGMSIALEDLAAGHIGAVIKLFEVLTWLVKDRSDLAVVEQIPTHEKLGIAFAKSDTRLCTIVNKTLANLKERGIFDALSRKWYGDLQKQQTEVAIKLIRLFIGEEEQFHFVMGEIEWDKLEALNALSCSEPAQSISFEETARGASFDWHNTPHGHYVIALSGRNPHTDDVEYGSVPLYINGLYQRVPRAARLHLRCPLPLRSGCTRTSSPSGRLGEWRVSVGDE
jgi:hypothetical protein